MFPRSVQELYAYGLSNIVSSFFQTYPAAASLSRSAVQVSAGGRTQVATLFSSVLLILVLFFIGPLFYHVPNCCLSAIIVVALKGMFIHAVDLKYLWKYSIWDFTVWLLTFFCTMIFDLKYGLLTGIAFSALTVILRTQAPPTRILGQVDGTELYRDVRGAGGKCVQPSIIKVIRYEGSIYYTCAEHFRLSVYQRVGLDPLYVFNRIKKLQARLRHVEKALGLESSEFFSARKVTTGASPNRPTPDAKDTDTIKHVVVSADGDQSKHSLGAFYTSVVPVPTEEGTNKTFSKLERRRTKLIRNLARLEEKCHLQFVVLDCSCWSFVDYMGADELNQLVKEFRQLDIHVLLAQLNDNIVQSLHRNGKLPSDTELFPTVHDAVLWAVGRIQTGPNHLHNVHDVVDTYNRLVMNQFENLDCSADDDEEDDQENGDNHHGGDIENNEHHPVREDMITPNQIGYKSAQHEPNERDNDSPTPV
ncbi:unnamed protein product [Echinostoma caproni]|uniref:STAS domain-containing protein n=1 Tax=Echinostoma caproni TaxID=27848 RepID=A0A3P8KXS4_9TREM|nr:unnamed protein product [Echinostoma caproni]